MKAKGLVWLLAALLLAQTPLWAIQPDRWVSPAPMGQTPGTSEVKPLEEAGKGLGGFFDALMSPFRWLTGQGGK